MSSLRVTWGPFTDLVLNGNAYNVSYIDTAVADAGDSEIRITTPSSEEVVIFATIFGTGDADISLFEDTTFSAAGTTLTSYNLRRSSSNTAGSVIRHTPTVSADGTELLDVFIPGTVKKDAVPFGTSTEYPRILDSNTEYLLRYTNQSGSVQDISWVIQYGELS